MKRTHWFTVNCPKCSAKNWFTCEDTNDLSIPAPDPAFVCFKCDVRWADIECINEFSVEFALILGVKELLDTPERMKLVEEHAEKHWHETLNDWLRSDDCCPLEGIETPA